MFFNVPGGLLNTDGIPVSVAPGPDWLNMALAIAAALVVLMLTVILARGNQNGQRSRHQPAPRVRSMASVRTLWTFAHRHV